MFRKSDKPKATHISIDLGGYHVRIFHESEGLILDEPSIGAIDMSHRIGGSDALGSFGHEAHEAATASATMQIVPVLHSDTRNPLGHSAKMLRHFLSRLRRNGSIGKAPVVLLTIPPGIPQTLQDDLKHACFTSGASRVHMVDNAISSATGIGLSIEDSAPQMVLDLGARAARLYAIQFNEIVAAYSSPFGGDKLDAELANGIRERYGLYVSDTQAQQAKHLVGSALTSSYGNQLRSSCQMHGLQISNNEKTNFTLTTEAACELLQPAIRQGADALAASVQALPYQFRDSQQDVPIFITGGGSYLPHMDQLVMEAGNRPVEIAQEPEMSAVRGGGILLAQIHGADALNQPA